MDFCVEFPHVCFTCRLIAIGPADVQCIPCRRAARKLPSLTASAMVPAVGHVQAAGADVESVDNEGEGAGASVDVAAVEETHQAGDEFAEVSLILMLFVDLISHEIKTNWQDVCEIGILMVLENVGYFDVLLIRHEIKINWQEICEIEILMFFENAEYFVF